VKFLGHTISGDGISVDPSKVREVMDWKPPTSVLQIRSFLGLVGYYRRFIPDFSRIAKPMTELLKEGAKFSWDQKCEDAFHTLRDHLTTAPVLAQPDVSKSFDIYCDASGTGLGCVLMQDNRVIAYASRRWFCHNMRAMYQCLGVKIQIMGREFCANPIVLLSSGIDIILGMGWLTKYDVVIHYSKRSVLLTSSGGEQFEFATLPSAADCAVNQLKADLIEDIKVVCEYPHVFPDDLPGMPHEHDIEFLIDLLPSTAPFAKRPYRMLVGESEELKK
jgi:hypothetical protein